MALTVRKLAYALGAEVTGLDLRQRQSDETIAGISSTSATAQAAAAAAKRWILCRRISDSVRAAMS